MNVTPAKRGEHYRGDRELPLPGEGELLGLDFSAQQLHAGLHDPQELIEQGPHAADDGLSRLHYGTRSGDRAVSRTQAADERGP